MYQILMVVLATIYCTTLAQISNSSPLAQTSDSSTEAYVLPRNDSASGERQQQLIEAQSGYLYGPSIIGDLSHFLTGLLGDALVNEEVGLLTQEVEIFTSILELEAEEVVEALQKVSNNTHSSKTSLAQQLAPFLSLYRDQWKSSNPDGLDPGAYSNYTEDLYFSMERLSVNPVSLRRLNPNETLPYNVADNITTAIAGTTLLKLQQAGRLFVVDYSAFADLVRIPGRYSAACTAYFFIHPGTEDFLPLAIKTNTGADLIYTPLDSANDWFLAKTLFESNDNVASNQFHLSATHAVAQIVHEAALRMMAEQHPVRGYLDQIMYRAYAVDVTANKTLFNPGGYFDQNFAFYASSVLGWTDGLYRNTSGHFQANYFDRYFVDQGLVNCSYGPALSHFPFYEDAVPIVNSLRSFAEAYVQSYYPDDLTMSQDNELQAWIVEANGPAQVIDFPPAPLTLRTTLVDILTQMAYLTGVLHHALNGATYATSQSLPLHPIAHYQPLPMSKGIGSVVPYLPNFTQAISQITLAFSFNRPSYKYDGLDLLAIFQNPTFLSRTNNATQAAAAQLQTNLAELSAANQAKAFDSHGLSQGMPFIYRTLDPMRIPFFLDI